MDFATLIWPGLGKDYLFNSTYFLHDFFKSSGIQKLYSIISKGENCSLLNRNM